MVLFIIWKLTKVCDLKSQCKQTAMISLISAPCDAFTVITMIGYWFILVITLFDLHTFVLITHTASKHYLLYQIWNCCFAFAQTSGNEQGSFFFFHLQLLHLKSPTANMSVLCLLCDGCTTCCKELQNKYCNHGNVKLKPHKKGVSFVSFHLSYLYFTFICTQ